MALAADVPENLPDARGYAKVQDSQNSGAPGCRYMKNQMMQILLIEDQAKDAELFREMLREQDLNGFELTHVAMLREALEHIANGQTDLVVTDLDLPDAQGPDAIRQMRSVAPYVPLVVVTDAAGQDLAMQALREGAQDYLTKGDMNSRLLLRSIRLAVEHQRLLATIRNPALLDGLTLLLNREGFQCLGDHYLRLARFTGNDFVVFHVDVDGLRQINDSLGRPHGDEALMETAGILKSSFRKSDVIARLGGDEFAVLMIDAPAEAIHVVRPRLKGFLDKLNSRPRRRCSLSLSTGVVACRVRQTGSLEEVLARAEALMREEKNRKNAYTRV
jgi:two-component system cell cycle response regulator